MIPLSWKKVEKVPVNRVAQPILVVGIGNILQGDEGVGVRVVEHLQTMGVPAGVEVLEAGTVGLNLLDIMANRQKVIVVDAVQGGGKPGAIYRFDPRDAKFEPRQAASAHQIGLLETLQMAHVLGCSPKQVTVVGVEPKAVDWGLELSAEVAAAVPRAADLVLAELRRATLTIPD